MINNDLKKIVITGGAGYVGSALVPLLLDRGYEVTVFDLFLYGKNIFDTLKNYPNIHLVQGDIRNTALLYNTFQNKDCLIHLACISNDPSFDLNPDLGRSVNYEAFRGILQALKESSIRRFIYASSSSVYGVSKEKNVTELTHCNPLTDYSKYKLLCEEMLKEASLKNCIYSIIRPATVCGYAPRLRLDLTVNILTLHALIHHKMTVLGGDQLRPHIHIQDMIEAYRLLLESPANKIVSQTFNAGYENRSVLETARLIQQQFEQLGLHRTSLEIKESNDKRSYHIDSSKMYQNLNFTPKHSLRDAVNSLIQAYQEDKIINPLENSLYYNIKRMQELQMR